MTFSLLFWIIMLLWVLGSWGWVTNQPWGPHAFGFGLFILIALLGWHDFGPPIHS